MSNSNSSTKTSVNTGKHREIDANDKKRPKSSVNPTVDMVATKVSSGPQLTQTAGKPDDVYATTVRSEELESRSRPADQSCADFRTMLAEICQLKLKAADATAGSATAEKLRTELAEKRMDGANQLVIMKKLNRMDKVRLRSGRDALHKEKLAVDSNHLQLQNLLYEAEHLRKEVQRCFQFKSQDEEIELVPEQQFYEEAPAEISRPDQTRDDEHSRRLARLEWELQQRKQLAAMCTELQLQKKLAAKHIDSKTDRLESLAPHLESLLRATRPLQEALSLPVEDTWKVNRVARLLPAPLYMAYENLSAYADACDKLLVAKINGDESDVLDDIDDDIDVLDDDNGSAAANNTPENSANANDPDDEQMESDGEERARHHYHHHHNHHRREQQQVPPANSSSAQPSSSIEQAGNDEAQLERLLRAHPLSVSFEVRVRSKSAASAAEATLNVTLRYLSALNLVTATCSTGALADEPILSAASLLTALTAGDLGLESPNPKTHYQLRALRCDSQRFATLLATKKLGRPYRWAQQLCGLDMSTVTDGGSLGAGDVVASLEVTQASVPQVVRQIRQRWQSRLALCEQIRTLTSSIVVKPPVPCVAAVLLRWQAIDWSLYSKLAAVQRFVQSPGVIDEHDLFYTVTVGRGTVARFECAVRVSVQHPRTLPLWALSFHGAVGDVADTAQTNAIVREIESWINSTTASNSSAGNVLAAQLQRAQTSLDIYLETTDGASAVTREKTFLRAFRSRTRSRPLRSIQTTAGSVIFTQV